MLRKTRIAGLIMALALSLACTQTKPGNEQSTQLNIIYILADDMGSGDIQALNAGSRIGTPTRYGVLTGRYCFRSRLKNGVLSGYSTSLIEPGRMTVASLLSEQGYHTGCVGKWHLMYILKTKQ